MNDRSEFYTVEAMRFYAPGERYSAGAGVSLSTLDGSEAMTTYAVFAAQDGYAIEVRKGAVLLAHSGPPMADAIASMRRAWRERFAANKPALVS